MSYYRTQAAADIAAIIADADPNLSIFELKRRIISAAPAAMFSAKAKIWMDEMRKAIKKLKASRNAAAPPPPSLLTDQA